MSNKSDLLKSIIKNPSDIIEDASLDKYLLSRGINPKFATKDQKVAHSKTTQFISWKRNRMMEDTLDEVIDKKDTVTLDIPLLIRVLELAREDIRTDMDLHRVVEKLINIRKKGMLTMKDYNYIAKIHENVMSQVSTEVIEEAKRTPKDEKEWDKVAQTRSEIWRRKQVKKIDEKKDPCWTGYQMVGMKKKGGRPVPNCVPEEVEPIDEITTTGYHAAAIKSRMNAAVSVASSMGKDKQARTKLDARNRGLKRLSDRTSAEMKKANSGPQKPTPPSKPPTEAELRGYGQGRYMGDSVEHDESLIEAQSAAVRFQKALQNAKKKREEEERRNAENVKRALTPKPVQEAACACETSKSARIIKSLYKKKGITEDMYDFEKDDKSTKSYGKKPKMATTKKEFSFGEKKPEAAAVLTGGTTLTGQPRDTVEIDPMMRKRPGPNIPGKTK